MHEGAAGGLKERYWQAYQWAMDFVDPFPYWRASDRHRCLFIHIPKTAGTSVLKALGARKRLHLEYSIYQLADPKRFRDYYKFCFVRNPWDRALSTYRYFKGGGAGRVDEWLAARIAADYPTFERWVIDFLDESRVHEHPLLRPQYLYIYNIAGECLVDRVGRFESINEDFQEISQRIGLRSRLPYLNKSVPAGHEAGGHRRSAYAEQYTTETAARIAVLYREDCLRFAYELDAPAGAD